MKKPHRDDFPEDYQKHWKSAIKDRFYSFVWAGILSWFIYSIWNNTDNNLLFVSLLNKKYLHSSYIDDYGHILYWIWLGFLVLWLVGKIVAFKESFDWRHNAWREAYYQYLDAEKKYKRYIQQIEEEHDLETIRMIRRKRALNEIDNESAINAYAQLAMIQNSQNKQLFELVQNTIQSARRNEYKKLETGLDQIEKLLTSDGGI